MHIRVKYCDRICGYFPGFIAAYLVLLVGASSPGPSVAMLIGIATSEGRAPAMFATLGIAFGSVTLNILTLLGVGLILSQMAWGMSALRIIGAAYLLWLAIASIGATDGGGFGVIALFVTGAFLISFTCHGAWAVALSTSPIRVAYAKARRFIEAGLGVFFAFAAYKIVTSEN